MENLRRLSLNVDELDANRLEEIKTVQRVTKTGALRFAIRVGHLVATGQARLVDNKGKPMEFIVTG